MAGKVYTYSVLIKEVYLDFYGHVNNAMYLTLFEEARWEFVTQNGYGVGKIKETGLGPVILGVTIQYLKEIHLREKILIQTQMMSYDRKIGRLMQKMMREEEVCCTAEFTLGLFSMQERKLVIPTSDWLKAIGWNV
jgi:YbgC/YbaW family acyl-CoA thioester hydrolase